MRIGIFGGSFNPIHNGHLALAREIVALTGMDQLWFVVSPQNPLKPQGSLLDDQERYLMARLAVDGEERLAVSDCEFRLPRPSYMLNTLRHLSEHTPLCRYELVIGADNWQCFPRWYGYEDIIAQYPIHIYPREGCDIDAATLPSTVHLLNTPLHNVSSTQVRQLIRQGKPFRHLVPEAVAEYITRKQLYL